MVVPVLMTSCQVSEYPNIGPLTAHTTTIAQAITKALEVPSREEACREMLENDQLDLWGSDLPQKLGISPSSSCLLGRSEARILGFDFP